MLKPAPAREAATAEQLAKVNEMMALLDIRATVKAGAKEDLDLTIEHMSEMLRERGIFV